MKEKKGKSKSFIIIIISICLVLGMVLGVSIYFFMNKEPEVIDENLDGGDLSLTYADDSNIFSITKAIPMTNELGMKMSNDDQYFDFTIDASFDSAEEIDYEIYIEKVGTTSTISDKDIRIYLEKQNSGTYEKVLDPKEFTPLKKKSSLGSPKGSMVLYSGSTTVDVAENYRLRMWLSDKAIETANSKDYTIKVNVTGKAK